MIDETLQKEIQAILSQIASPIVSEEKELLSEPFDRSNLIGTGQYDAERGKWTLDIAVTNNLNLYEINKLQSVDQSIDDADKKDWQRYFDDAYAAELERRKQVMTEEEARYMVAQEYYFLNADGELQRSVVGGKFRYSDNMLPEFRLNELGYDTLPPDLQQELGDKDKVIGKWTETSEEWLAKRNAYVDYQKYDQGYDTWEEYRDAKGFGKQEEVTIENAQQVDSNDKPRETPTVDQEETQTLKKL